MRGDDQLLAAARPLSVDDSDWHSAAQPPCPQGAPASSSNPAGRSPCPSQRASTRRVRAGAASPWPAVRVRVQCV